MKKSLCAMLVSLLAFSYAADVSPTLSLRIDDMLGGLEFAAPIIGIKADLGNDVSSGFDAQSVTDGAGVTLTSSRIYVERSIGRIGLGTYHSSDGLGDHGKPYFTIGTSFWSNDWIY